VDQPKHCSWENALPCEVRRGPLWDLDLHVFDPELSAEANRLGPVVGEESLFGGQIDEGLEEPAAEAGLGDAEIDRDLSDLPPSQPGKFGCALTDLRRVRTGRSGNRH